MPGDQPTTRTVLSLLQKARILEVAREFGVATQTTAAKDAQIAAFVDAGQVGFRDVLGGLRRDELKATWRVHGPRDSRRARPALAARLLQARWAIDSVPPPAFLAAREMPRHTPPPGDIVPLRQRHYLVLDAQPPRAQGHETLVVLAPECPTT